MIALSMQLWHKRHPASGAGRPSPCCHRGAGRPDDEHIPQLGPRSAGRSLGSPCSPVYPPRPPRVRRHDQGLTFAVSASSAAGPPVLAAAIMTVPGIAHTLLLPAFGVWVVWTTLALARFRLAPGHVGRGAVEHPAAPDWIVLLHFRRAAT